MVRMFLFDNATYTSQPTFLVYIRQSSLYSSLEVGSRACLASLDLLCRLITENRARSEMFGYPADSCCHLAAGIFQGRSLSVLTLRSESLPHYLARDSAAIILIGGPTEIPPFESLVIHCRSDKPSKCLRCEVSTATSE